MTEPDIDDQLDLLVAEYSDRLARGGSDDPVDLLERIGPEHRGTLQRCLRMIRAGLAPAPVAGAVLGPGVELGEFRIVGELGRGGMSVVYRARQLDLEREVALKVLRPGLAVEGRHVDRFKREALAVARLQHPHIVQVYAVGEALGYHYIAMELVQGKSLAEVYEALPSGDERTARDLAALTGMELPAGLELSFEQALAALLGPVARAIGTTHELGLVHRDIKPSNILVHRDGRAVVADFGLAKGDGDPGLSLTGEPLGTPFYMSPEQAALSETRVDQRTDVYSLGVTFYEGLTGRRPFEGDTVFAVFEAVRAQMAAPVRSVCRRRSKDAEAVVRMAMQRDPARRYASALELALDLEALAKLEPTRARTRSGGALAELGRFLTEVRWGQRAELRSATTFLGLPLYHFVAGRRFPGQRLKVAKGWIAVGEVAVGGFAMGGLAAGGITLGGLGLGVLPFAGLALGIMPVGGISVGLMAVGGMSLGFAAVGGVACGHFAAGGVAWGNHTITDQAQDPAAIEWFRAWWPFVRVLFPNLRGLE